MQQLWHLDRSRRMPGSWLAAGAKWTREQLWLSFLRLGRMAPPGRRGERPLRNTAVRMPGPSWAEKPSKSSGESDSDKTHHGIACEENYHDALLPQLDPSQLPCLSYTRDLRDWRDFIRRTPDEYEAWVRGVSKECETLELQILDSLSAGGRAVFVDTKHIHTNAERNIGL